MATLTVTRTGLTDFDVVSGANTYRISKNPKWNCSCPARGACKHLRTALGCNGLEIGGTVTIGAKTSGPIMDEVTGLTPEEFDAEAGRDVMEELRYWRSGAYKRNYGC